MSNKFYEWCLKNPTLTPDYKGLIARIESNKREIAEQEALIEYILKHKALPEGKLGYSQTKFSFLSGKFLIDEVDRHMFSMYAPLREDDDLGLDFPILAELEEEKKALEKRIKEEKERTDDVRIALKVAKEMSSTAKKFLDESRLELEDFEIPEWLASKDYEDMPSWRHLAYRIDVLFPHGLEDFDCEDFDSYYWLRDKLREFDPSFDFVVFGNELATAKSQGVSFSRSSWSYRSSLAAAIVSWIDNQWDILIDKTLKSAAA